MLNTQSGKSGLKLVILYVSHKDTYNHFGRGTYFKEGQRFSVVLGVCMIA